MKEQVAKIYSLLLWGNKWGYSSRPTFRRLPNTEQNKVRANKYTAPTKQEANAEWHLRACPREVYLPFKGKIFLILFAVADALCCILDFFSSFNYRGSSSIEFFMENE